MNFAGKAERLQQPVTNRKAAGGNPAPRSIQTFPGLAGICILLLGAMIFIAAIAPHWRR